MKTLTFKYFALIITAVFLTSSLSFAGSKRRGPVTITVQPDGSYRIKDIIDIPVHVDKFPAAPISRNVPASRMVSLVDHATRINPATLTMTLTATAAAAAAGYIIDELTDQIISIDVADDYIPGYYYEARVVDTTYYGATPSVIHSRLPSNYEFGGIQYTKTTTDGSYSYYSTPSGSDRITISTRACSSVPNPAMCNDPDISIKTPVTEDQLRDSLLSRMPNLPSDDPIWPQILGDSNGNPYWTPERMDAFDDFWRNYGQTNSNDQTDVTYDHDAQTNKRTITILDKLTGAGSKIDVSPEDTVDDPTTSGTDTGQTTSPGDSTISPTTPDITNPTETTPQNSTGTTTNTSTGSSTSTQWPAFCGWATKVCDFIDWMTAPAPLPVIAPPEGIYDAIPKELPTLEIPSMPTFLPSKSDCETITLTVTTFHGTNESQVFPTPSQCAKLKQGQVLVGWFLYVITWFGVVYIIFGHRGGRAQ